MSRNADKSRSKMNRRPFGWQRFADKLRRWGPVRRRLAVAREYLRRWAIAGITAAQVERAALRLAITLAAKAATEDVEAGPFTPGTIGKFYRRKRNYRHRWDLRPSDFTKRARRVGIDIPDDVIYRWSRILASDDPTRFFDFRGRHRGESVKADVDLWMSLASRVRRGEPVAPVARELAAVAATRALTWPSVRTCQARISAARRAGLIGPRLRRHFVKEATNGV